MAWCALVLGVLAGRGSAQDAAPASDATAETRGQVIVALKDGSRLVGTIVVEDEAGITLRTGSGVELRLPREALQSVEAASSTPADGPRDPSPEAPPPGDPNDSRLMFSPSGRPLRAGSGYFSDHYVLFPGFAYGLTKNLSVAAGVSTVPGLGLSEQLFYGSAQLGFRLSDTTSFSVGGLYTAGVDDELEAAVGYGIAAFGPPDRSLSLGLGVAATPHEEAILDPRPATTWAASGTGPASPS
jgi:hypothetical protein